MPDTLELGDIQGNILHPFGMDRAAHFLVHLGSRAGIEALLKDVAPVVNADTDRDANTGVNLWLTHAGLGLLGLDGTLLGAFPEAFRTADFAEHARCLGDVHASDPEKWENELGRRHWHVLVAVHADKDQYVGVRDAWHERLTNFGHVWLQEAGTLPNAVEHFGFADGASQPAVEGVAKPEAIKGGGVPLHDGGWRPVKAGEFVLGYDDEDGPVDVRPAGGEGFAELVRNGSYVVWRKLEQNVPAFWKAVEAAAMHAELSEEQVAAKIVGRFRDGIPIEKAPDRDPGDLSGSAVKPPPNNFRYLPDDEDGQRCPVGAHIRRSNPRDSFKFGDLPVDTGDLTARHRIIRRGMPYGRPHEEADEPRGLLFVCYNADFERQFEVIQRAWCADGDAFYLGEDQDFLLANKHASGRMKIPVAGGPPRFIETRPDLVVTQGMEYLFAPGLAALKRLASGGFK